MVLGSDMLDDGFPHGTVAGYDRGCRGGGAVCSAAIPCRDVKRRYGSDLDFRRLIDAGVPLAEIVEIDAAAAEADRRRDRNAVRVAAGLAPLPVERSEERIAREAAAPLPAAAGRPKPSVPSIRPAELVQPVPDVDEETGEPVTADNDSLPDESEVSHGLLAKDIDDLGLRAEAITAPERPRKWAVRKVWAAVAPDGSLHGPFDDDVQARTYVSAQFPALVTSTSVEAAPHVTEAHGVGSALNTRGQEYKRVPWSEADIDRMRDLWEQGLSDAAIERALGRPKGTVSRKLRSLGLATNGKPFGVTSRTEDSS